MDSPDLMSTVAVMDSPPAHGVRVHVSDASPHGFWGHVTAVHRDAVTVTRDSRTCELVILSRRRVTVVMDDQGPEPGRAEPLNHLPFDPGANRPREERRS